MNTEKNNLLLAYYNDDITSIEAKVSFTKNCSANELNYHENWNLLMEVALVCKQRQQFGNNFLIEKLNDALITCDISKVYKACVEFIKWEKLNDKF